MKILMYSEFHVTTDAKNKFYGKCCYCSLSEKYDTNFVSLRSFRRGFFFCKYGIRGKTGQLMPSSYKTCSSTYTDTIYLRKKILSTPIIIIFTFKQQLFLFDKHND